MSTINLIHREIEQLSDIDWLVDNLPQHVINVSRNDYYGNTTNNIEISEEAQARIDELQYILDQYDIGEIDYKGLLYLYNMCGEPLVGQPAFSGAFSTGDQFVDNVFNLI